MQLTPEILSLRPYLFTISYNMLGMIEESEDIVQDVFEKWIHVNDVNEPKYYLGKMVVNKSINRLNELKKQRETYVGEWLPEPYITFEENSLPTIEYGLLFLLEKLNPVERAVFILRESFGEDYGFISEITGEKEENCRQILHRSHEKLQRNTNRSFDKTKQSELTQAFLMALHQQDQTVLNKILKNDIELYSDGGGKRAAALKPLFGIDRVLKFLTGVVKLPDVQNQEFEVKQVFINGLPGAIIYNHTLGEVDSMQYVEWDDKGINKLLFVRNPDKLKVK